MRKRALLAGPSFSVGLALTKFAESLIKEEKKNERKKKRHRTAADGPVVRDGDERDVLGGGDSGGEGSTNRVEARKRPVALDEGDSNDRLTETTPWIEPGSSLDLEEDSGSGAAEIFPEWSLPTDTLVAIKMMCAQFPKISQNAVRPFVLRSQLYSSVSDRTTADRELEELKQQQVVRIFKLHSGKDDFAIMLIEDYIKQIEGAKQRIESKRPEEDIAVFDWFQSRVINAHTGASIRHSHLVQLLSQAGDVLDKQITLLINSGLLVRQSSDETTYWFGIPSIGLLLKSLTQGRKELTSFLARRRYKEMIQAVLEKKRLRTSQFDMRFHIRDLLGSGHIYSISTPVGPLIRLSHD
ncbi:hypothetical protein Mapa_005451 [Marchantia paleacea]|nr:hypothetical protein Mapa_005451 [Marchantia paleacea]